MLYSPKVDQSNTIADFLMIFGPNTATGHSSVILASENMVEFALKFVKLIINGDATTFDVKREAEEAYTADIQKSLKNTVWHEGGCQSWYFDRSTYSKTPQAMLYRVETKQYWPPAVPSSLR